MEEVRNVAKTERNNAQGFNFRGIDAVVNAVAPALRKHGVIIVPTHVTTTRQDVQVGAKRTPMQQVEVCCTYTFYGPEGDCIYTQVVGEAMDAGDKATAKAMSVAFRTLLLQALCLPTDDPDPDASSYERAAPEEPENDTRQRANTKSVTAFSNAIAAADTLERLDELAAELKNWIFTTKDLDALRSAWADKRAEVEGAQ